jgi:RNA polymerase sigma-70 factor (sigma-E family)
VIVAGVKEDVAGDNRAGRSLDLDPSFDEFVSQGSARLLRSAYLLTGDRAHAEDLLQIALVRTARRWDRAREAPAAYAYRVLVNLIHDHHRRLTRRVVELPLTENDAASPGRADHAQRVIDHDAIMHAVRLLAPRQREVVVLRFFADLSVSETAAAIGSSQGSVKVHTSRALGRLREILADDSQDPNDQTTEVHGAD